MARPAPAYTQHFVDHGRERLGLHVYPEPADGDSPVVLVLPAMGTPARYYAPLAEALWTEGLAVVVADLRGTGSSTPRPSRSSRYGYAGIASDVGAVVAAFRSRLGDRPVLLLGHSLGGQAAVLHVARTGGDGIAGIVLIAVGLPWFRSYPGRRKVGVLVFTQAIVALAAIVGFWPGWGFGGRQARGVIRDWGYTARHGRFPDISGVDPTRSLAAISTPVLAISVEHDRYTPTPTVDHLAAMMPSAGVERRHLTSAEAVRLWIIFAGYAPADPWRPGWPRSSQTAGPAGATSRRDQRGRCGS